MARHVETLIITVLAGNTTADIVPPVAVGQARVSAQVGLGHAVQCSIYGPAVLAEVAAVQVSPTDPGVTWYPVTGVVPAAASVVSFAPPACKAMRLSLNGAAAADRVFSVVFQYTLGL